MLALIFIAAGCRNGPELDSPPKGQVPTYHRDIAPLLATHCEGCHSPGGIAPRSLTSYEEVASFGPAIAHETAMRTMPPFNLDNSGACNTWMDANWLTDDEIAMIGAWVDAGAPEGEPVPRTLKAPVQGLDRVDLTVSMEEPYTPDTSIMDDYRCFVIDPGITEDHFITAFEAHYGEPQMVHHMTLFALESVEDEAEAIALDEAAPGPGYPCPGDTVVSSRWLVGSGPGDPSARVPEGMGIPMLAGRKTVLQMHYNRANGTFPDLTTIDLKTELTVPFQGEMQRAAVTDLDLPPGEPVVVQSKTYNVGEGHTLWGVWPHMHNLGTKLQVVAERNGEEICLARVDNYQFHWQAFEFYNEPVRLEEGDTLRIDCTYDTTSRDTTTTWGEGTDDEMCIGFFYLTWDD